MGWTECGRCLNENGGVVRDGGGVERTEELESRWIGSEGLEGWAEKFEGSRKAWGETPRVDVEMAMMGGEKEDFDDERVKLLGGGRTGEAGRDVNEPGLDAKRLGKFDAASVSVTYGGIGSEGVGIDELIASANEGGGVKSEEPGEGSSNGGGLGGI